MSQYIAANLSFSSLNQLDVCLHPVFLEVLRKQIRDVRIRV